MSQSYTLVHLPRHHTQFSSVFYVSHLIHHPLVDQSKWFRSFSTFSIPMDQKKMDNMVEDQRKDVTNVKLDNKGTRNINNDSSSSANSSNSGNSSSANSSNSGNTSSNIVISDHTQQKQMDKWSVSNVWEKSKELSRFYLQGTKTMGRNFYQAYKLRAQINNRIFRKANRREIMFINSAYVDFCKFIPFFLVFILPLSTILIPVIGHFVPSFLPSGYQRPSFLEARRKRHTARRREISQILNEEFLRLTSNLLNRRDMDEYHLEASLLQSIIQRIEDERNKKGMNEIVPFTCRVLEDLTQFEHQITQPSGTNGLFQSIFTLEGLSTEVVKNMSLFSLASRSEYGGVSGGTSTRYGSSLTLGLFSFSMSTAAQLKIAGIIPVPHKLRIKALRKYVQMIRADDELIADFSVFNLKPEELRQALYVRGFNIYGEGRKLSLNELQELLQCWIEFSRAVKTETLFLLAPVFLWWG